MRSEREEGAERKRVLRVCMFYDHERDTNEAAQKGAGNERKEHAFYAAKRADHGEQLYVAAAHALLFAEQFIRKGNSPEHTPSQ